MPKGVSCRFNKNGVATSIQITFTYKGILCREKVNFVPDSKGVRAAANLLGEIKNQIAMNSFFYADYFPKSSKLKIFSNTTSYATVEDYLNLYIDKAIERGLANSTITGYEKAKNGLRDLWKIPVPELETLNIVNLIENSTLSRKTLSNRPSLLSSSLNRAIVDKMIKVNPASGIRIQEYLTNKSKINARNIHEDVIPFTPAETRQLIRTADDTVKAIVALLFDTGIRSSEWVALKKVDVCLISKTISIFEAIVEGKTKATKTKSGRRKIPISQEVCDLLKREMAKTGSEYVFLNSQGNVWNQDSFRKHIWKKLLSTAGVKYRYPYQTRHTFATRLISEGMNLWKIAKLMGHTSHNMLYTHYGNYIDAYEKIPKANALNLNVE